MERTSAAAVPTVTAHVATGAGAPTTVLIVDSSAAGAGVIEHALAATGDEVDFRVEWVTGLPDALERLAAGGVEVVLVGLRLPGCDGRKTFTRIRAATPDALILPLSETGDADNGSGTTTGGAGDLVARRRAEAGWLPEALRYVTRRKEAEAVLRAIDESLFAEKERAQVTLNSIGDAVLVTDLQGDVTYLNPMAEILTGWTHAGALGRPLSEVFAIVDATTREPATTPAQHAMREDRTVGLQANCVLLRRDGGESGIEDSAAPIHDRHGRVSGAVIVFRDVTQSRAMARKLAYLAQHDVLTGLANRALLDEQLTQAIRLAQRHQKLVALLFVDLDHFKQINDSLGHRVGDHVLQAVARRLTECVRASDTVSRHGGDEFLVLLSELEERDDAARVSEKLLAAFAEPLLVDGHTLHVTISIGVSIYPDDGDSAETIMQQADAAMYHSRINGNDHGYVFRAGGDSRSVGRADTERNLRRALTNGELVLHYRPRIDLGSGEIDGVEALIRWLDPDHGLVHPDRFLPQAERCGLAVPIGHWALQEACRQASGWQACGLPALPVAVNVTAAQLRHERFAEDVAEVLRETALDPAGIELEVPESAVMQDVDASIATLTTLREMGVRIALDDFGAGYSSLGQLRHLPIDTLRIDAAFVAALGPDREGAAVLRAMIQLGRGLGCRVVAQGVENLHQLAFVHLQRCDSAQGAEVGKPLAASDFSRLLARSRAQPAPRPQQAQAAAP